MRRRMKWCSLKKWRVSRQGNRFVNHLSHHVVVYPVGQRWGFALDGKRSQQLFTTEREAMLGAFDAAWPQPRPQPRNWVEEAEAHEREDHLAR